MKASRLSNALTGGAVSMAECAGHKPAQESMARSGSVLALSVLALSVLALIEIGRSLPSPKTCSAADLYPNTY
ncbi:hypothetical protein C8255_17890 [filamentous cyanobacterium CCP3]|nr:hypothetical protein C8255_17890 [filamentous cyanobacterium CCP3]